MGVVAPLTAVVAAIVPVAWGVANGERPSAVVVIGVVSALAACALISRNPNEEEATTQHASGIIWAFCSGAFLGTSLVFYVQTSTDSGLWPVLAARVVALVLVAIVLLGVARRGPALTFPKGVDRSLAFGAGFLDVIASTLLLLAVRRGLLTVVAPVAALSPVATVLLARVVIGERLHPSQRAGLVLALIGLVMIVAG